MIEAESFALKFCPQPKDGGVVSFWELKNMSYYMIDAARYDAKDRLTHVHMGEVDNVNNRWVYEAKVTTVEDAVNTMHGSAVVMVRTDRGTQGATVKIAVDSVTGREFIMDVDPENHPGGTLKDLPTC